MSDPVILSLVGSVVTLATVISWQIGQSRQARHRNDDTIRNTQEAAGLLRAQTQASAAEIQLTIEQRVSELNAAVNKRHAILHEDTERLRTEMNRIAEQTAQGLQQNGQVLTLLQKIGTDGSR